MSLPRPADPAGAPVAGATGAPPEPEPAHPALPPGRERPSRRRRVLLVALVLLLGVLVVGSWAALAALRGSTHLQAVRADVAELRDEPPDEVAPLVSRLRADRDRAAAARRLLDQPGPRLAAAVPVLGRSLEAERAVARAGEAVLVSAVDAAEAADRVPADGGVDLAALAELSARLRAGAERTGPVLADLGAVDTDLTPGVVQEAVAEARDALVGLDGQLATAAAATEALGGVLGAEGPRRVLVALENNAELRGRGGLVSVFATGATRDGRLELDGFRQVQDVADPSGAAARVPAPPEVAAHYGRYQADTTTWKQANMPADGPASAATLAAVAGQTLGEAPDVVVLVDVPAMAAVVSATEPVTLPDGRSVDGDELVHLLLVDAYEGAGDSQQAQDERRTRLAALASGAASRLVSGGALDGRTGPLLRALVSAAQGRHVAVWSARPDEQAALERAGLAGSVDPRGDDLAMVTTNNLPGNKLDLYVERHLSVDVTVGPGSADVVQRLRLRNDAPEYLPWYVEGRESPGRAASLVDMAASPDAVDLALRGPRGPVAGEVRRETGSTRVVTTVGLDRGREVELELRYRVPLRDGAYALRLLPQPLAEPATLDLRIRAADGAELGRVTGAERSGGSRERGGEVAESGDFEDVRRVTVELAGPDEPDGVAERIARFLREPVRL